MSRSPTQPFPPLSSPSPRSREYVGNELELFQHATHWKSYYGALIRPYLLGDVLEVGAGIGATARALADGRQRRWTALEPDPALAAQCRAALAAEPLPVPTEIVVGTLDTLPPRQRFDTVLYIDVLEHIEEDGDELRRAAARLRPGGALVVLSPAHQWLYSPFDARIGHFRRYSRRSLAAVGPATLRLQMVRLLDAVGMLASAGNRLLLRQDTPTRRQIRVWDSWMVPFSRFIDPLCGYRVGKSVLAIWRAPE